MTHNADMEIKPYSSDVLAAVSALYLKARVSTFSWLDTRGYTLSDFERDTEGERILVAFMEGQVIGFIAIWEPDHFIHHLYVSPEYQGKGVGTRLLAEARSLYGHLRLKCMVKNEKAVRFYASHGFIQLGKGTDHAGDYFLMGFNP